MPASARTRLPPTPSCRSRSRWIVWSRWRRGSSAMPTGSPPETRRCRVVRLGVVILPELRWPSARELWTRAEALGFDHAWTYDHLAWRTLRDSSWFGAIPVLTAAATVTTTLRLGVLVASPNFRHPVAFAR